MACKRSAVRSRLAPPAFARFASFGSASPETHLSRSERRLPRRSPKGVDGPGKFIRVFSSVDEPGRKFILFLSYILTKRMPRRGAPMKYVYILESLDSKHFYVGITDDLRARLTKHNAGEVPHTSKYGPWRIKTYIAFSDEKQAIAFEKYLKSGSGRAFANKRL